MDENIKELISAYDKYIEILNDEIGSMIGLARVLLDLLNGENFAEIPAGSLRGFLEASDIVLALSGKLSSLSARLIAEGKRAK